MKKYNYQFGFSEGLSGVKLNGKWGFINECGEEVIPLIYDKVSRFRDGIACVELNGQMGFITHQNVWYNNEDDYYNTPIKSMFTREEVISLLSSLYLKMRPMSCDDFDKWIECNVLDK